ncbi:unnamed protein product [Citrullus colocynthis]|uniref:Uncharacterized protein n=1 Tax=Citrullus colocynthis TaxID=252529 RepID=A0ABP0YJI6_9ROSI
MVTIFLYLCFPPFGNEAEISSLFLSGELNIFNNVQRFVHLPLTIENNSSTQKGLQCAGVDEAIWKPVG